MNALPGASAIQVLGDVDAAKFRSCLTLFSQVEGQQSLFAQALNRYYQAGTTRVSQIVRPLPCSRRSAENRVRLDHCVDAGTKGMGRPHGQRYGLLREPTPPVPPHVEC